MGTEALTNLLTICLAVSVFILFVLIIIFFVLSSKEKKKNAKDNKKEESIEVKKETQIKEVNKNIIQTKMYTIDSIKNFMNFDEIKDNMILQKDGKRFIMIIQCYGVNYDLMSSIEKSGVEQGFSQFLNTLTKPIQLHVQARKVNLEESVATYKKRLEVIESNFYRIKKQYDQAQSKVGIRPNELKNIKTEYAKQKNLFEYTKDIIANTERLSLNQNILTKNYYIAISHTPDTSNFSFSKEEIIEMSFSELYTNAQAMLRTLAACGVTGKILDSVELADLLYVAYNRDSSEIYDVDKAIKSGYDALYTTAPDVINKKMEALDKLIDERAVELANETINKVTVKSKREKELEEKEKNMDALIREMARTLIEDSKNYVSKDIIAKSIEELEKEEQFEQEETKKETKKKVKKGA